MIKEVEIYKAIGEETRLRILRLLIKAGTELCACEIIDVLGKPQYTISKNLGILVSSGLLKEKREGRMMFYELLNNESNNLIFENIKLIKCENNEIFKDDFKNLKKRLAERENNVCVKCDTK
jgi:ArsR family transcriptional regulator, arsenate/arsenite/antimonite-responsive transcriptional repressor